MNIAALLNDKDRKPKAKTEALSAALLDQSLSVADVIEFAASAKDPLKATCIEALEFATKQNLALATLGCLEFVSKTLTTKAPRVKWESARVIGNIAHRFPANLEDAIRNLLENSEHEGTVVRWSAAFALGEIYKLKTSHNAELLTAFEAIVAREEKRSIQKIYREAIKKASK
ncbi:MAG: hypothetical protein RLZZ519_2084 [Bacteroidota bacterium]|jgi:HEAT repeat protein